MRWRKIIFSGNDVRQQKSCRKTTTRAPRLLLVFAVLVLFCAAGAGTAAADTIEVENFQGLCEAIYQATGDNSTRTVIIIDDIPVGTTAFPEIGAGKSITLTPANDRDYRIYRTDPIRSTTTGLFTIDGGSLTITDNGTRTLTLDGNNNGITSNLPLPLVYVCRSGTFTLDGGALINNYADNGGGVYLQDDSAFTMSGGTITNNSADNYGGGVYLQDDSAFTMSGGTITNNSADNYGGGVYVNNSTFTLSGGSIADNVVLHDGGGVYVDNGTFAMSGGLLTNNHGNSGGVHLQNNSVFTMSGGKITNHDAGGVGGVYLQNNSAFTMSGGEIANNIAESNGGGVCVDNSTFTLIDGRIINNTAPYGNGGGVYVQGDISTFTMEGGEITGNNATNSGGGVYVLYFSTFKMNDGEITNNNAVSGGGVYVLGGGTLTMSGGEITNNNANSGGGIDNHGTFTMNDGEITGNTARQGGGIDNSGRFTMSDGEITNNNATDGGGVHSIDAFTIAGGEITNNTAVTGGGVLITRGSFMISDAASIDATNELYLSSGMYITVGSALTGGAQNITHEDNVAGTTVVSLPQGTADVYQSNFTLSPYMFPFGLKYENGTGPNDPPKYKLALLYNVTVTDDGHGAGYPSPAAAVEGTEITLTAVPNTGWSFSGWQVVNGSVSITSSKFTMPEENVTVRAVFTANAVPTLESGDGNMKNAFRVLFETFGGSTVAPITFLSYGDSITAPASPTKDGYTFGGWYKEEACVNAWMFASDTIPGDITLYAKWNGAATPTVTATSTVSPTIDPTVSPTATVSSAVSPTADTTGNQNQPGDASDGWDLMEISLFIVLILIVIFLLLFFFLWRRRNQSRRNNEER